MKTIIPLALVGYQVIIANSALCASLAIDSPYPVKCPVLRWRPVLSRLYLRFERSNKNTRIEDREQSSC